MRRLLILILLIFAIPAGANTNFFSLFYAGDFHSDYNGSDCTLLSDMTVLSTWFTNHYSDAEYSGKVIVSAGDLYEGDIDSSAPVGGLTLTILTNYFNDWIAYGYRIWICPGNHDANQFVTGMFGTGMHGNDTNRDWNKVFPLAFFTNQVGFITNNPNVPLGSSTDSRQCIMTYTNPGGTKLIWLPYHHSITNAIYVSGDPSLIDSYIYPDMRDQIQQQTDWLKSVATNYPDHMSYFGAHWAVTIDLTASPNQMFRASLANNNLNSGAVAYFGRPMPIGRIPLDVGAMDFPNFLGGLTGHNRQGKFGRVFIRNSQGKIGSVELHNYQGSNPSQSGKIILAITFNDATRKIRYRSIDTSTDTILREMWIPYTYPTQKRLLFNR